MYSKVYGQVIKYCENHQDNFITQNNIDSKLHGKSIKPLSETNPQAAKYVNALSKLFSEIPINLNNLWIVPIIGTQSVRIYFSDPIIYPVSTCCQKCVIIDMQNNLNGSIICPQCKVVLVSFIHYEEDQPNQVGSFEQLDKRALFREKKKQNQMKNRLMYENLTSNKFKTKNLRKVLENHSKLSDKSFRMNSTGQAFYCTKENNPLNQRNSVDQQRKDGFILQVKTLSAKDKQNMNCETQNQFYPIKNGSKEERMSKNFQEETKRSFDHQLSLQETRKIILDIFK